MRRSRRLTILGIDTATAVATVGVFREGRIVGERSEFAPGAHARALAGLAGEALSLSGMSLSDLDGIAVSRGPGSFTGLRIGISFAKGLAYAAGLRLVGVPTLEAMAAAEPTGAPWVAVCLDARKGEVYLAVYRRSGEDLEPVIPEEAVPPETAVREIVARCEGRRAVMIGDAAETHEEDFRPLREDGLRILRFRDAPPRGGIVASLGERRLDRGQETSPEALVPHYVRASEAEVRASRRSAGATLTRAKTLQ